MPFIKRLFTIILFVVLGQYCFAQTDDEKALIKLNHDWISSYPTRDTATMSRIFADDLVLISPNGKAFHKKDILRNLMSPAQEYFSARVDTVSVRIIGNIGLVNATATINIKADGKTSIATTCYLDVYEKRQGRWYAIASQVASLDSK